MPSLLRRAVETPPTRLAVGAGATALTLGFLGGLEYLGAPLGAFHLDAELTVPAAYSCLLLFIASALACAVAVRDRRAGRSVLGPGILVAVFGLMGADEIVAVHENFDSWFGLENWIVGYVPVIVVAGVAWLQVLGRLAGAARLLWVAGAVAWGVAGVLEAVMQEGVAISSLLYGLEVEAEELSEMIGSACFGLSLLMVLQQDLPAPERPAGHAESLGIERRR